MLFDMFFLGGPFSAAVALTVVALREGDPRFWRCAASCMAYSVFYVAGGRDVLLYLTCGMIMGHAWISVPGGAPTL
ncbi:MAG: hypothetical protein U0105_00755 [Candidatus Obscuribacterales bacterium]|jgi:hypothetical protein